jgi:hypothetical protein
MFVHRARAVRDFRLIAAQSSSPAPPRAVIARNLEFRPIKARSPNVEPYTAQSALLKLEGCSVRLPMTVFL